MAYSLSPWLKPRFFITGTNRPLAGGLMYTYKAGTTDNATTYSDDAGTPNTNPIVLDSDGQCDLFLDDAVSYRIILKNSAGVTQFDKDRIASLGSTQVQSFNSIAALRLRSGTTIANAAKTLGYYSAGDGGGNSFYWDSTSTATDNAGTVIKPTAVSGAGRWIAVNKKNINLLQFGAIVSDVSVGVTNQNALLKACQALEGTGGALYIPSGTYTIINQEVRTTGGFKIIGDGYQDSVLKLTQTASNKFFVFKNGGNVTLRDFSIIGEYADESLPPYGSEPSYTVIDFRNSDNNFLENVSLTRIWCRGINLTSSKNTHIKSFDIEAIYNCIQINDDSSDLTNNVYVSSGTLRGFAVGGFIAESDDSLYLLENVYIRDVNVTGHVSQIAAQGISFTKSTSINASDFEKHKNIHITNCCIRDCFQASAIRGARGVHYSNIQINNVTRGFDLGNNNAVHDVFINDITINGNGSSDAQGITVYSGFAATPSSNSNNITITNVTMREICAPTAALLVNAENFTIKNVAIYGTGAASSVAIETQTKAANFSISECFISDFVGTALKINGTSTAKAAISSNTVMGGGVTTNKGIDITSTSSNIVVSDNDVVSGVTTPITINNAYRRDNVGYDVFFGSMTYDAPSIPAGQMVTQLVTCTGSVSGFYATGSFTNISTGIQITYEARSNSVLCTISNSNTAAVDMPSGTLRVKAIRN